MGTCLRATLAWVAGKLDICLDKGNRVAISGSGNVATFCVEKLFELGAVVVSMSDSGGCVIEKDGFTAEQFKQIREIKERRGRIKEYKSKTMKFVEKEQPWKYVEKVDVALPSATQNEICKDDALALVLFFFFFFFFCHQGKTNDLHR